MYRLKNSYTQRITIRDKDEVCVLHIWHWIITSRDP